MDTLVSQSFGAGTRIYQLFPTEKLLGNYELVGIVTQNALLVVTVAAFPIAVLWLVSESNGSNIVKFNFLKILCYFSESNRQSLPKQGFLLCI